MTVERMAGHLEVLLGVVAGDPDARLGEIDVLPGAERARVVGEWNETGRVVAPVTLAGLFEAQVARTPDGVAVVFEGGCVSFAELDGRANRLARVLIERGAGPERVVALALPRSVEIVVAELAVAKAGAAFLPVDPAYPPERIGFMLADAEPVVTVTRRDVAGCVAGLVVLGCWWWMIRRRRRRWGGCRVICRRRRPVVVAANPAYVIFTSGSTGRPKGVVVPHAGLASFAAAEAEHYRVRAGDRVLQFPSPSFDASVLELCMSLPAGAALVVPPPGPLLGQQLAGVLAGQRVTHALIPPAALATVPAGVARGGCRISGRSLWVGMPARRGWRTGGRRAGG